MSGWLIFVLLAALLVQAWITHSVFKALREETTRLRQALLDLADNIEDGTVCRVKAHAIRILYGKGDS